MHLYTGTFVLIAVIADNVLCIVATIELTQNIVLLDFLDSFSVDDARFSRPINNYVTYRKLQICS